MHVVNIVVIQQETSVFLDTPFSNGIKLKMWTIDVCAFRVLNSHQ